MADLEFKAKVDIAEAKKRIAEIKAMIKDVGGISMTGPGKTFDTKPMTEYQAGLLKVKQETLELAKAKAAQAAADRSASMATQAALKEEARIKREQIAAEKALQAEQAKKKTFSVPRDFKVEIEATNKLENSTARMLSTVNAATVAAARLNVEQAKAAIANNTLIDSNSKLVGSTQAELDAKNKSTNAVKLNAAERRQLAIDLAAEKLRQADANKETKNSAREQLNAKGSIEQRRAALIRLTAVYDRLNKAERESAAGKRLEGIIKGLVSQISALENATGRSQRAVGGYADGIAAFFNSIKENIGTSLGAVALLTAAWVAAKAAFSHNVEISDNFTDVQRTAKLSKEEVREFGKELKDLDTRTSLEGLLDIGFIGGRLSVPKEELKDFVKQVDELAVVLKKEFPGGAEAVAESLGKIVSIYKVTQTEGVSLGTALSKVGSDLLELAHRGPVTVKFLQDFTLGVAGTAASANLSIPVISAYGAVLGEAGQIASSSALSITRLVTGLTTKTGKYFAIAQLGDATLTIEKFTNIVNTDAKQALDLFFRGLKAGNPAATEIGARLATVGITTGKVTNAVKILANNQDKLADRVKIATKAFDEGTSVAHNFELANNNLAASVDKLHNTAVNLTTDPNGSLAGFFKGIIDGSTYALKAIQDLDNALTKSQLQKDQALVDKNKPTLFNSIFNTLADRTGLAEAKARLKANASQVLNNEISGKGYASADILAAGKNEIGIRKLLTSEINKQKIAVDRLGNALAFVANPKNTAAQTASVEASINRLRAAARQQSAVVERLRAKLPKDSTVYGDGSLVTEEDGGRTTEAIKAEIKALTDANKKLAITTPEFKKNVQQIVALRKELKLALGGKDTEGIAAENKYQTALKARNSLQKQIDDATVKGVQKQESADEQEIASVTKKYQDLRDLATKFNNDPGNKKKGLRVDGGKINDAESTEKIALVDKQDTEKLKVTLDEQKSLYDDFENYKTKVGEKRAKERYAELLKSGESYYQALEIRERALSNADKNKGGDSAELVAVRLQLDLLDKEKKKAKAESDKRQQEEFDQLLDDAQTFEEARNAIIEKYIKQAADLRERGRSDEADQALANGKIALENYDLNAIQQISGYKKLFDGFTRMSGAAIREYIQKAKDRAAVDLANGKISQKAYDEITAAIRNANFALSSALPEKLREVGSIFKELASSTDGLSSGLTNVLNVLGDMVNAAADVKQGINETQNAIANYGQTKKDAGGGLLGSISAISSVAGPAGKAIGAVLNVAKGIKNFFNAAKESAAKAKAELESYNDSLVKGEIAYNQLLRERERTLKNIGALSVAELKTQQALLGTQKSQAQADYDRLIAKINASGEQITGTRIVKSGGFLGIGKKSTTVQDTAGVAGLTYDALEKLFTEGKLTDATKAWFQELQKAKEELEAIGSSGQDVIDAINQAATGTTASSIADGIIAGFKAGKRSAADFADDFKGLMEDAALSVFKSNFLNGAIDGFYKQFAAASEDGLSEEDIKKLRDAYSKIITDGASKLADFDKVIGGVSGSANTNTLQGAIQGVTAEKVDLLAGNIGGLRLTAIEGNGLLRANGISLGMIHEAATANLAEVTRVAANTLRTANNTDRLAAVEKAVMSIDKKMDNNGNALQGTGRGG